MANYLSKDQGAVELRPEHPWRHAGYSAVDEVVAGALSVLPGRVVEAPACPFVSSSAVSVVKALTPRTGSIGSCSPWTSPETSTAPFSAWHPDEICTIETGAHLVLVAAAASISTSSTAYIKVRTSCVRGYMKPDI